MELFSCTKTINTTLQKAYKNTVLKKKKTAPGIIPNSSS